MKIIGLMGQAGSGKDTVADWLRDKRGFLKIAFADRMKVYAKEAYRVNPASLWGPSELRSAPITFPETQWLELLKQFGVHGSAEAFIKDALPVNASPDDFVRAMDGLQNLFAHAKGGRGSEGVLTVRSFLQLLGTEWGRKLDEGMWIRLLYEKTLPQLLAGRVPDYVRQIAGAQSKPGLLKGLVIPDHRFENEVAATIDRGGTVFRVSVEGREVKGPVGGISGHASEEDQKRIKDKRIIDLELPYGLDKVDPFLTTVFPE